MKANGKALDAARTRLSRGVAVAAPQFDRLRLQAGGWYRLRSRREQVLLAIAAGLIAIVLLVFMIVRPLQDVRANAIRDIRTYDVLLAHARAAGPRLVAQGGPVNSSPSAVATSSADRLGLAIRSMEPQGGGLRVSFDTANFDALMQWIAIVERDSRLHLGAATIERAVAPGVVSAQLTLIE